MDEYKFIGSKRKVYFSSNIENDAINTIQMVGENDRVKFERIVLLMRRVRETMAFLSKQDDFTEYQIKGQEGLYKCEIFYSEPHPIGNLYFHFFKQTDGELAMVISQIEWTYMNDKNSWWYKIMCSVRPQTNVRYPFLTGLMNYRARHKELF